MAIVSQSALFTLSMQNLHPDSQKLWGMLLLTTRPQLAGRFFFFFATRKFVVENEALLKLINVDL